MRSNTEASRSRPSRFRCPIEPRSLAIAVVISSRSATMEAICFSTSSASDVGAEVHRPHLLALLQQALQPPARLFLHLRCQLRRRIGHRGLFPRRSMMRSAIASHAMSAWLAAPSARTASSRDAASAASTARAARSASADVVVAAISWSAAARWAASAASSAFSASARRAAICAGASRKVACSASAASRRATKSSWRRFASAARWLQVSRRWQG